VWKCLCSPGLRGSTSRSVSQRQGVVRENIDENIGTRFVVKVYYCIVNPNKEGTVGTTVELHASK
jgi:hypothetical protein